MKQTLLTAALAGAIAQLATAQEITPKWFQHINETKNVDVANRLPILKKAGGQALALNGTDVLDAYSQLIRYDANRLLLGVRENGINETDAALSAADKTLAEQYPDRSLIWIDANTGQPLGIAWKESLRPDIAAGHDVTLPENGGQGSAYAWWRIGLDEGPDGQKALYSAFKHIILRYAPKVGGGWETTPTLAYEEQVTGVGDGLSSGDGSASWRFRDFHVRGSGKTTQILAGGGTWRAGHHAQLLVTDDGLNFKPLARVNDRDGGRRKGYSFGGTSSFPVEYGSDPTRPKLSVVYRGHFPGTGWEARPDRYTSDPANPTPAPEENEQPGTYLYSNDTKGAAGLPPFQWEAAGKDGLPINHAVDGVERYDGNWNGALAADSSLSYLVAYSLPSWNNQFGDIKKPAWLAIHRLNGSVASGKSAVKLDFDEDDEEIVDYGATGHDYLYDPWIQVNPDKSAPANLGKSEVLVAFGSTGFGVFTVENVAATLVSSPANQTVVAGTDATLTADVTGSPNDFQWYRNGVPVPATAYYLGAKKVALKIVGVTPADAGSYQLKWTNPLSGAGETAAATLTVTGNFVRWTEAVDVVANVVDLPLPTPGEIVTNANSFTLKASGYGAFDKADAVGDNGFYRYESVTGDFDKRVRLVNLKAEPELDPVSAFTRASLMVRESKSANTPALEIAAANPAGANQVRVMGRGRRDQVYSQRLSRDYAGVAANLPSQWLRVRRVGNSFSFYLGTNGTTWSKISDQYQVFPATVLVGTYAATDDAAGSSLAVAEFADYGDVIAADTVAPKLVSTGTIDKHLIGLKFSEALDSTSATTLANYSISQGTLISAQIGLSGDTVYLHVAGLTSDTFTVTVVGSVVDRAGNAVASGSTANGKKSNWISTDIGYIQNPASRPTPGDDPYVVGRAVALSSDENPEFEIIGGGSNAYNPGDFIHYLYRPYSGDFDVVVAVNRFDRRGITGGYANGGIHVRAGLYRTDNTDIAESTKVPAYVNIVYYEASGPNRAAIELNRPNAGDNYGNNAPNSNDQEIAGLKGFFSGLFATDAAGTISENSSPTQAHWLRVKRVGTAFTSLFSYDGLTWVEQDAPNRDLPNLGGTVLVGFGNQNDTGYGVPPNNTYAGNGTVNADGLPTQNESNYGVLRISHFGDFATAFPKDNPTMGFSIEGTDIVISFIGTLQSADTITGSFGDLTATSPLRIPLGSTASQKFYRARN
jgi:hypothetical protein